MGRIIEVDRRGNNPPTVATTVIYSELGKIVVNLDNKDMNGIGRFIKGLRGKDIRNLQRGNYGEVQKYLIDLINDIELDTGDNYFDLVSEEDDEIAMESIADAVTTCIAVICSLKVNITNREVDDIYKNILELLYENL